MHRRAGRPASRSSARRRGRCPAGRSPPTAASCSSQPAIRSASKTLERWCSSRIVWRKPAVRISWPPTTNCSGWSRSRPSEQGQGGDEGGGVGQPAAQGGQAQGGGRAHAATGADQPQTASTSRHGRVTSGQKVRMCKRVGATAAPRSRLFRHEARNATGRGIGAARWSSDRQAGSINVHCARSPGMGQGNGRRPAGTGKDPARESFPRGAQREEVMWQRVRAVPLSQSCYTATRHRRQEATREFFPLPSGFRLQEPPFVRRTNFCSA